MDNNKLKKRIGNVIKNDIYNEYPDFPKKGMLIEVTNLCNDSCLFCFNRNMSREKGFIDSKFVFRILQEAYDLGMREVGFYTTGEPLLNNDIGDYIETAKKIGYTYTYITTNGFLANIDKMEELIKKGLNSIKFSINAISKEEYKFIHGKDDFETVTNNLKELYEYKIKNDLDINIFVSYIKTKYTNEEVDKIKSFFDNVCDEVVVMNVENQGGLMPEINDLLICEDNDNDIDTTKKIPCSYPFKSVIITREGYLTACCLDFQNYLAYSDLNKNSLKDAWYNSVITNFRKKQLEHDSSDTICTNCINNKKIIPNPLIKDLASNFSYKDNSNCIIERIDNYLKNKNNK